MNDNKVMDQVNPIVDITTQIYVSLSEKSWELAHSAVLEYIKDINNIASTNPEDEAVAEESESVPKKSKRRLRKEAEKQAAAKQAAARQAAAKQAAAGELQRATKKMKERVDPGKLEEMGKSKRNQVNKPETVHKNQVALNPDIKQNEYQEEKASIEHIDLNHMSPKQTYHKEDNSFHYKLNHVKTPNGKMEEKANPDDDNDNDNNEDLDIPDDQSEIFEMSGSDDDDDDESNEHPDNDLTPSQDSNESVQTSPEEESGAETEKEEEEAKEMEEVEEVEEAEKAEEAEEEEKEEEKAAEEEVVHEDKEEHVDKDEHLDEDEDEVEHKDEDEEESMNESASKEYTDYEQEEIQELAPRAILRRPKRKRRTKNLKAAENWASMSDDDEEDRVEQHEDEEKAEEIVFMNNHETPKGHEDIKQYDDDYDYDHDHNTKSGKFKPKFLDRNTHLTKMEIARRNESRRQALGYGSYQYPAAAVEPYPNAHSSYTYYNVDLMNVKPGSTKWVQVGNEYGQYHIRDGDQEIAFKERGYKEIGTKTPHPSHSNPPDYSPNGDRGGNQKANNKNNNNQQQANKNNNNNGKPQQPQYRLTQYVPLKNQQQQQQRYQQPQQNNNNMYLPNNLQSQPQVQYQRQAIQPAQVQYTAGTPSAAQIGGQLVYNNYVPNGTGGSVQNYQAMAAARNVYPQGMSTQQLLQSVSNLGRQQSVGPVANIGIQQSVGNIAMQQNAGLPLQYQYYTR